MPGNLTLHFHPLSSFSHKVLIALYENGTPFEKAIVNYGDPQSRDAFFALWPLGKIPVLHDDARDHTLPETSIIIEYLDRHYPGAQPLLPRDPEQQLEARLWDRIIDQYIHTPMQKLVNDRMRPDGTKDATGVDGARTLLGAAYPLLDRHMAGKQWVLGNAFSLADCAAAPALFYGGTIVPFTEHANLAAYFERLVARPSVARTLVESRPFFQYYPYKENIPARFLEPAG
jgi:glutathione S-transferase